jgi:lysophospholipase L1-like esterase
MRHKTIYFLGGGALALVLLLGFFISRPDGGGADGYTILCLGDSLTRSSYGNYPDQLTVLLRSAGIEARVQTEARPGNNSGEFLTYLRGENPLKSTNPDMVILMLGTNDVRVDGDRTPGARYAAHMEEMIRMLKNHRNPDGSKAVVFVATVPPIFTVDLELFDEQSGKRIEQEIVPAIRRLARQEGVNLIDLYDRFKDKPQLLPGIHPTERGYRLMGRWIFQELLPFIKGSPAQQSERLPGNFGGKIAFQSDRSGSEDIFIIDRQGVRRLTHSPADDGYPVFSPDGQKLVFESNRSGRSEIYITDLEGKVEKLIDSPSNDRAPFWTYDGKFIYFGRQVKGGLQVFRCELAGRKVEQVTHGGGRNTLPAVSADGRNMLITANRFLGWDLYRLDLVGGGEERYAPGYRGCRAKFAHSGSRVVFVSHKFDGRGDIFLTPLEPFKPVRLTVDAGMHDYYPAFSPDDRCIVYASGPQLKSGNWDIKIMEIASRRIWRITSSEAADRFPYWGVE